VQIQVEDTAGKGSLSGIGAGQRGCSLVDRRGGHVDQQRGPVGGDVRGNALPSVSTPVWTVLEGTESLAAGELGTLCVTDNSTASGSRSSGRGLAGRSFARDHGAGPHPLHGRWGGRDLQGQHRYRGRRSYGSVLESCRIASRPLSQASIPARWDILAHLPNNDAGAAFQVYVDEDRHR